LFLIACARRKITVPNVAPATLAIFLLLPLGCAPDPSSPSATNAAQVIRTIPFEKPSFEQRRTLLTVPAGGCTAHALRSLDSGAIAILVQGPRHDADSSGESADHFRDERLVVCTGDNKNFIALERDRTGSFAPWNTYTLSWEPGGRSLVVAAYLGDRTNWFRVSPADLSNRYALQDPVIGDYCEDCDHAKWAMQPYYTIYGTMRAAPYRQRLAQEDERETGQSTHFDFPNFGGMTQTIGGQESTAYVDQRSGTLIIATGETVRFAKKVNAAITGFVLLFNWNGRALAATWTTERYGDLLIRGVPGAFRTVDLGPDTTRVKPIARLGSGVIILVDDGEKSELLQVHP